MWTGRTGKGIRGEKSTQLLYAYLITCPHANMIGLYHLPVAYIQADLALSPREIRSALERLRELGFLLYDFVTERIWVIDHWRHELGSEDLTKGENGRWDNRGLRAVEQLRAHLGSELARRFLDRYPNTREFVAILVGEDPLKGLPSPSGDPSEGLSCAHVAPAHATRDARVSGVPVRAGVRAGVPSGNGDSSAPLLGAEPPPLLVFPCIGKPGEPREWGFTEAHRAELADSYDGIDVLAEARKALAWVRANRPKTARGMPAFLVNWLNKEARSAPRSARPGNVAHSSSRVSPVSPAADAERRRNRAKVHA